MSHLTPVHATTSFAGILVLSLGCTMALTAADDASLATPALGDHPTAGTTASGASRSLHSWELPAIVVDGNAASVRDADLVGDYGQPRWSTERRFSEVRTYVIPKGQVDFEYWLKISEPSRHDRDEAEANGTEAKPEITQMYEVEMGLGYRFQLDLYQVYVKDGSNGDNALDATKFEVRYALADWGKLWANPTIYTEWEQAAHGADSAEVKLLLCDDITDRLAWATNFVAERKTGDDRSLSLEWNSALGYSLIDEKLSVGVETNIAQVSNLAVDPNAPGTVDDDTRVHHWEVAVGPSIRFHPIPNAHIIVTEFVGLNDNTSAASTTAIFGWEF